MSALDAPVAPHFSTAEAKERQLKFVSSPNRLKFALAQSLLPRPGTDFLYTDITPLIAAGAVQHATKETLLDFDKAALFGPMGFRNEEWMHQDSARIDNASYGLRMRPIDMQKFGILYLHEGCWNGHRLLSREWVQTSFTSWIRSRPGNRNPNYGWYWWKNWFAFGWVGHVANGWKGQRIAVLPDKNMVVSMTALVHDGSENNLLNTVINQFVIPASGAPSVITAESIRAKRELKSALRELQAINRIAAGTELRLLPTIGAKERHLPFN